MSLQEEQKEIENFNKMKAALLISNERDRELYSLFLNHGAKICSNHDQPSKKTMEELSNIKVNQARHEEKLDSIKTNLESHISKEEETFARLEKIVTDFMETTDQKFAGKWLETLVVRLGWLVMTPLVGGACYGVWQLIRHLAVH